MYTQLEEKAPITHSAQSWFMIAQRKSKPINNEYVHNYSVSDLHNYCFPFFFSTEASGNIAMVSLFQIGATYLPAEVHKHDWE